jgi:hypothetical protein
MARTPTDPTKAQVWITKGIDDLDFEFYFPQGPKGDPGGYTSGTSLNTTNLNAITVAGIYKQDNGANATLLQNYPVASSGILHVDERIAPANGLSILQTYYPFTGSSGVNPRQFYRRYLVANTTWGPWESYVAQRVDQTAGRAIYTFDTINQREQLIYGDTGWRDITTAFGGGVGGALYLRRANSQVSLQMAGFQMATAIPNGTAISNLPVGFRPTVNSYYPLIHGASRNSRSFYMGANGTGGFNNAFADENYSSLIQWSTIDAWPTSLPGASYTGIPNT